MNTQWIALVISLLGFLASVYYSNKNSKKTDIDDVDFEKKLEESLKDL